MFLLFPLAVFSGYMRIHALVFRGLMRFLKKITRNEVGENFQVWTLFMQTAIKQNSTRKLIANTKWVKCVICLSMYFQYDSMICSRPTGPINQHFTQPQGGPIPFRGQHTKNVPSWDVSVSNGNLVGVFWSCRVPAKKHVGKFWRVLFPGLKIFAWNVGAFWTTKTKLALTCCFRKCHVTGSNG